MSCTRPRPRAARSSRSTRSPAPGAGPRGPAGRGRRRSSGRTGRYQGVGSSLYAFAPDGSTRWSLPLTVGWEGALAEPPAIGDDGTLYVAAGYGAPAPTGLYAISPAGQVRWTLQTSNENKASPVVGADGTIYTRDRNSQLYAVRPDGTLRWQVAVGSTWLAQGASIAIGHDGTLYVGTDVDLEARNPATGAGLWSYAASYLVAPPVVGADGTIFVASGVGGGVRSLNAVNPDGTRKWVFDTPSGTYNLANAGAAVAADGSVYALLGLIGNSVDLVALRPDGTLAWRLPAVSGDASHLTIDSLGRLYVATISYFGSLQVIDTCTAGLADSPWPKAAGGNLRNTGNFDDAGFGVGCDAGFTSCGGACVDEQTDANNCGGCGVVCAPANATPSCTNGACTVASCNPGFGDCDGNPANGCEAPLDTDANCGGCGVACAPANGTGSCATGACAVASCNPDFSLCNGTCVSGVCACVEGLACTPTNPCHLGSFACTSGTADCQDLGDLAPNGTSCGTNQVCDAGVCTNCTSGGSCTGPNVDPCALGTYSCATGTQQCVSGGPNPAMPGKPCGGTGTCTSGLCNCGAGSMYYEGSCESCPAFSGTTVYVDAGTGTDNICCGRSQTVGLGGPCATLTQALTNVQGTGWTINFTGDANGNAASSETYPIQLSNGVAVQGQSQSYSTPTSCIPGVSGKPVVVANTDTSLVGLYSILVGTRCDGASAGASIGVLVANGARLSPMGLGISGVNIGIDLDGGFLKQFFDGAVEVRIANVTQDGIHCESVSNPSAASGTPPESGSCCCSSPGCVIFENAIITGAQRYGMYIGNGCSMNIVAYGPWVAGQIAFTLGAEWASGGGLAPCPTTRAGDIGIYMEGNGSLNVTTDGNSTQNLPISCLNGDAIVLAAGSPNLNLAGTGWGGFGVTISKNGGAGLRVLAGTANVSGTIITDNHWGVIQQTSAAGTTGLVNLSNGGSNPNQIYCNGKSEPGAYCTSASCPNGANLWNDSALPLAAAHNYWANSPPSACTCNSVLASCTCTGAAAGDTTPPDGIDVLSTPFVSGGTAGVVTTTGPLVITNPTCAY